MYTADELATLDAASINWPAVPEELDRYANGEACAANRATDGLGTSSPGQRASSGVNPIWFAAATLLGRDIGSSAAWNSELFDVHRVRIDLEQTLDDICLRAPHLARSRKGVEHPLPDQLVAPASGYAFVGAVAAADAQRAVQQQERVSECSGATSWVIASNNG